ncbi:uncharacterized protein UHOD_08971 [Ustilago sp. UG-2017b]|nr:uncharacterized protein UHOD_08971 [Ustilago sp. UG-2017b]
MAPRKIRLLGLHGKGTSARIMKTQIKPIIDALGGILEVDFLDGGHVSCPYQGIESVFPRQAYYSWYEQPTAASLQSAHNRVADKLCISVDRTVKEIPKQMVSIDTTLETQGLGVYTPPETPTPSARADAAAEMSFYRSLTSQPALTTGSMGAANGASGLIDRRLAHVAAGLDTPDSYPRTPMDAAIRPYDGLICFSQGCAVSTGLLLELGAKLGYGGTLQVQFVILICGGRPFDRKGTLERVDASGIVPIDLPSVHIQGRQDAGLEESKKLASLYSESGKQVIELDIGHCPPRRTSDVGIVAAAIRKVVSQLI